MDVHGRTRISTILGVALGAALLFAATAGPAVAEPLTPKAQLGKQLFADTTLSSPPGQSCLSCHDPAFGFADPDAATPTSAGILPLRFGNRNSPTAAYAFGGPMTLAPRPRWSNDWSGGTFWDGRADGLAEQAMGPFLNPLEMHAPNARYVVLAVRRSTYADLFLTVYGDGAFDDVDTAYGYIADAIAEYERSSEVNPFTSKYDYYLRGQATLTPMERMGLMVFNGKGKCNVCHFSTMGGMGGGGMGGGMGGGGMGGGMMGGPLFTDHRYHNVGTPRNVSNPFYTLSRALNPLGAEWTDYGLGAVLAERGYPDDVVASQLGKFKTPTLRNVTKTAPYMHNGVYATLAEVVHFYNWRDANPNMPLMDGSRIVMAPAEVPSNVDTDSMGSLGLTAQEGMALITFLGTLEDGYTP